MIRRYASVHEEYKKERDANMKAARKRSVPVKACPVCYCYNYAAVRICPHCFFQFPRKEKK